MSQTDTQASPKASSVAADLRDHVSRLEMAGQELPPVAMAGLRRLAAGIAVLADGLAPLPIVRAQTPVFIGINVWPDGRLSITTWNGSSLDSSFARVERDQALSARYLPLAIDEAIELATARADRP